MLNPGFRYFLRESERVTNLVHSLRSSEKKLFVLSEGEAGGNGGGRELVSSSPEKKLLTDRKEDKNVIFVMGEQDSIAESAKEARVGKLEEEYNKSLEKGVSNLDLAFTRYNFCSFTPLSAKP